MENKSNSTITTDRNHDFLYAAWRFNMWMSGYGSYQEIEDDIDSGLLVPFCAIPNKCES